MPNKPRKSNLPPQFARARRRNQQRQPEVENSSAKQVPKKKRSFFGGLTTWFSRSEKTQKNLAPKQEKTAKPKQKVRAKKTTKKSAKKRSGVIAKKAAASEKAPAKKKKRDTKKGKKTKKKATKKSAVKKPSATKAKQSEVHFEKVRIEMGEELDEQPEEIETEHSQKDVADKRKNMARQTEVFPQLVSGAEEEGKPAKAERKSLFSWLKPKKPLFSFGSKKTEGTPKQTDEEELANGAIAALTKRMEGDDSVSEEEVVEMAPEQSRADVEQEVQRLEQEMAEMDKKSDKTARSVKKQRTKELKELRKKAKEYAKELEAEPDDEEEVESRRKKMLEVDRRIAEKEAEKKEKEMKMEEQERRKAQANKDLDAMAKEMVQKKKKKGGGISGVLKSINNLGMGKYRVQFVQNLAMMLDAGLPLVDALRTLQLEIRSRAMRKIIARIAELVDSGHPLWRAMDEQHLFSPYEVALVRVGEEAGNLSRNMVYLAEQQEKDHALKQKVKMAMIYPTIVFTLMFIVVMGLGLFVLPNLVQVLYSLNAELPATTRGVIFITELFSKYGMQAVPAMLVGAVVLILLAKYTALKVVAQWFIFKIPGIGRLAREATIARFGVILGGLLEAGVPLVESLQSLEDVTHIVSYKKMYRKMTERVALGDSFAICFKDIKGSRKLIPASMQQLIITGERSGSLSETFLKVASIYEKKAEETAEKLPTILEPMLLLLIGGLVGTIAFAIITPIYSVVGNVGR